LVNNLLIPAGGRFKLEWRRRRGVERSPPGPDRSERRRRPESSVKPSRESIPSRVWKLKYMRRNGPANT